MKLVKYDQSGQGSMLGQVVMWDKDGELSWEDS